MNQPLTEDTPTPSDFAARWNAYATRNGRTNYVPLERFTLTNPHISEETKRFLNEVGLPEGANLDWDTKTAGRPVLDEYAKDVDWSEADRARLNPFLLLGFTPGGDPVVLDTSHQEQIVVLNHENDFEPAEVVNASVAQLAECILVFQELIEEYQNDFGDDAELYENNVPPEMMERARQKIAKIDAKALADGDYWDKVLDYL